MVVTRSDDIPCPKCGKTLEVSRPSRVLGGPVGILSGWLVYRLTAHGDGMLAWVLPIVFAFLAYGAVSALFLMLTADLVVKPEQPFSEAVPAPAVHGGHH